MKTLAIYGPKYPEKTGVADYINFILHGLEKSFNCVHISNSDWIDPYEFDYVLYHIGSSGRHSCAFKALSLRPGPAIIHEYNCLEYYYDDWINLNQGTRNVIIQKFSKILNRNFCCLDEVMDFFKDHNEHDQYSIDIEVEEIFLEHVTIGILHSLYNVELLRNRYPQKNFGHALHPLRPLTSIDYRKGRELLGLDDSHFLFGTFGFIGYQKRVDKIIKAWLNWKKRPQKTRLLIVGQQQDPIEIPDGHDIIYLGYVGDINLFDTYLSAVDCGIQLRYPTFGETSGIVTKFVANNKRVIISGTDYNSIYKDYANVTMVVPDSDEILNLTLMFNNVFKAERLPFLFDSNYDLEKYCYKLNRFIQDYAKI